MAVGDQCLARGQVRRDPGQQHGVGELPQPVGQPIRRGRGEQRGAAVGHRFDDVGRRPAPVVEQQDRLQVGLGGPQQGEPVGDHVGDHVLVGQHHAVRGRMQAHGSDEAPLQQAGPPLLVDVQPGGGVAAQDAPGEPRAQQTRGLLVRGPGLDRVVVGPGEDQADHVVRVGRGQLRRVLRRDHVVRWGGDGGRVGKPPGVVAHPPERAQLQRGGGARSPGRLPWLAGVHVGMLRAAAGRWTRRDQGPGAGWRERR